MSDLPHCLAILKALEISEVVYHLSGGGDFRHGGTRYGDL